MCFEGKQYKCGSGGGHGGGKPMEMRWWWWKEIHINVVVVVFVLNAQTNFRYNWLKFTLYTDYTI